MSDRANPDPSEHPAHDLGLADRLVEDRIRTWLETAFATQRAGYGDEHDRERAALDQAQYLHMSGFSCDLVPHILADLRRARVLKT